MFKMKKEPERLERDLKKIFLTPPNTMKEKITLIVMMTVVFIMFFGPTVFSEISPVRGIIISALPAISVSWGVDGTAQKFVSEKRIF